uniref:arylesterase n=1 Tax=Sphingomonas bacterium TaxID=1895847 RepID=UPI00260BE269|nr:arylesterase [Sphingomonas bacterium]
MERRKMAYGVARSFLQALAPLLTVLAAALLATPVSAAPADKLVLAFGDSLTAGYGLGPAQAFPARLEASLRKSGVKVEVRNAGVSGDTSAAGRSRLAWVLNALKRKPDLVILELGANDMLRGLSPAQTRSNLDAILAELKRRQIRVLVAGMRAAPNMGKNYAAQFEPIYPQLARKYGATLYPFFLTGVAAQPSLLQADGMHPNARGVEVVVRGIAPPVARLLG